MTFSATPAVKLKPQVYIAKGSSPWYTISSFWSDKDKVISTDASVSGQATVTCNGVTNMSSIFSNCSKLTSLDLSNFDTSNVTNMNGLFTGCSNITSLDLSNFDTSKVTDMRYMFRYCNSLTAIKGVIDMKCCTMYRDMFKECSKLTGVKIKNPPSGFDGAGLSSSQYTIVS